MTVWLVGSWQRVLVCAFARDIVLMSFATI
jgi:hypothetical protein